MRCLAMSLRWDACPYLRGGALHGCVRDWTCRLLTVDWICTCHCKCNARTAFLFLDVLPDAPVADSGGMGVLCDAVLCAPRLTRICMCCPHHRLDGDGAVTSFRSFIYVVPLWFRFLYHDAGQGPANQCT